MTWYQVMFHHDEPGEAAAKSYTGPYPYRSEAAAIVGIRQSLDDYWQTGQVHQGTYHPATDDSPAYFEVDDSAPPKLVGPDWID